MTILSDMTKDEAILLLAEQLVWMENRLDPHEDDLEWKDLSVRDKHYYECLVRRILDYKQVVLKAIGEDKENNDSIIR